MVRGIEPHENKDIENVSRVAWFFLKVGRFRIFILIPCIVHGS